MKLRRFETPAISHFAYLLADGGEAAVIDPRRDVDEYLEAARELGVAIRYVIETHRQEDFVMGAAHLAERSGARIVNGEHDLFGHGDIRLRDGDTFELGDLRIRALHTPGHTPESMCYAVFQDAGQRAWGVFTGDALFYGDTGRTDLPDENRSVENAALLYDMIHSKLAGLGDGAQVLPAHGPGSVCGSGMAELPASTLGVEKQYNPVFLKGQEDFAEDKGGERMPRPPYFRHMEEVNLGGGVPPTGREIALLGATGFDEALSQAAGGLLIDTRGPEAFAGGHLDDAQSIWLSGLPVFGGWIAGPQTHIALVTERDADVELAALHLSRIGIDGARVALAGGFDAWRNAGRPMVRSAVATPRDLRERLDRVHVLDVRDPDEFASGHIPGAQNIYVGYLEDRLSAVDCSPDDPLVVTCSVGHRGGLALSILERAGFTNVRNLLGGMKAWSALDLPRE